MRMDMSAYKVSPESNSQCLERSPDGTLMAPVPPRRYRLSTSTVKIAIGPKFMAPPGGVVLNVQEIRRRTAVQENTIVVEAMNKRKRIQYRVLGSMFTVWWVFIACWLPFVVVSIWAQPGHRHVHLISFCGVSLNSLLNPILYGLCNRKIREMSLKKINEYIH